MDKKPNETPWYLRGLPGQAAVEYILIFVLVGGALVIALIATGPILGNIFQSAVVATIGQDRELRPTLENGPTSFWLTVTWVAEQTPEETPFPTNIVNLEPTRTPEDWVPPEPEPEDPTDVPLPTATDEPSPTPEDRMWDLPFEDVAADPDWYRLSSSTYLGQNAWTGLFWEDRISTTTYEPFGNPANVRLVRAYDANHSDFLTPITSFPNMATNWFSARYERDIFIYGDDPQRVSFTIENPASGYRIYYQSESGLCSNYRPPSNTRNATSPPIECLIVDEWKNAPADRVSAEKQFAPNAGSEDPQKYTLFIEYYQQTGSPNLSVDITAPETNPDDAALASEPVDCMWNQYNGDRTNTRTFSWSYAVGVEDMPNNSRCYLELRGYVQLDNTDSTPGDFTQTSNPPVMSFWHIWDLNPDANVWLEVSPYDPTVDTDPTAPGRQFRDDLEFERVWPPAGTELTDSLNYEWTKETVALTDYAIGDTITYRFVIQSDGTNSGRKRWYVDDVQIGNEILPDLTNTNPAPEDTFGICSDLTTCDSYWTLDEAADAEDFRTTGRWALTSNPGAVSGMAWEDDPGYSYSLEDGASDQPGADGANRIYWIEFDKRIDVSNTSDDGVLYNATPADPNGDTGAPLLTFWQTYNLKDDARLEVQYYDDDTEEWRLLRSIFQTGTSPDTGISRPDKHYFEVPLHLRENPTTGEMEGVDEGWTDWYEKPLRIRFAMVIEPGASVSPDAPGWTIDNILIERLGEVAFTPYPLYDSAGDGVGATVAESRNLWVRTGLWEVGSSRSYGGGQFAFSDSPNGDYLAGSDTRFELRAPIDLYSNTPNNPSSETCDDTLDSVDTCETTSQAPAENPTLTFWWNRDIAPDHRFFVEITPNGGAGSPVEVWEYVYDANDADQDAWERVEIALDPFLPDTGNNTDDDIIVTFRLDARINPADTADGVWIDDIRIEDNVDNPTFILGSGTDGGNGQQYFDNVDNRQLVGGEVFSGSNALRWWERFYLGGNWTAVNTTDNFPAKSGVLALHDSAPMSMDMLDSANSFNYETNTFNTIEMIRHIDLTNLSTISAAGDPVGYRTGGNDASPVLSWWQLYNRGQDSRLRVQIAVQDTVPDENPDTLTYGDDELYGWSEWKNVYVTSPGAYAANTIETQWVRQRVNLENAPILDDEGDSTGTTENFVGRVIRVRFVTDANDVVNASETRDGWFIDNIEFNTFKPRIHSVPFSENGDQGMSSWLAEGDWGMDLEHYRGGSDVPALGGDTGWVARYVNCDHRPPGNPDNNCNEDTLENMLTDDFYRSRYVDADHSSGDNADNRWYVEDFITSMSFDVAFDEDHNDRPPGSPNGYSWNDRFAAEWQRTVTVSEPFRYFFYTKSDDGARVGITPFPTTSEVRQFAATEGDRNARTGSLEYTDTSVSSQPIQYNNIINDWNYHAPEVNVGSLTLVPNTDGTPRDYIITLHYFEGGGGAEFSFGLSGANASYSDSPMEVPSSEISDRVPVNYYSDTSMYLDGLLDLRGTVRPILNFYTLYELSDVNSTFHVEISEDGGFTWSDGNGNLTQNFDLADGTEVDAYNNTSWNNNQTDWDERTFNLSAYAGKLLALRFRLDVNASRTQVNNASNNNGGRWNGANIASILVFDVEPPVPQPQIISQSFLNVAAEVNEDVLLELIATGASPLRYEWYQGNTLPSDPNVVPSDATLVASNVTSYVPDTSQVGTTKYWVRVSNNISDANSGIDPAISALWTVRVQDCVPQNTGDCSTYRIAMNNDDIETSDGSSPAWAGTNGSASDAVFLPAGNTNGADETNAIDIPASHDSYFVQQAINGSVNDEEFYENYYQRNTPFTWELPVENGAYVVKLYIADEDNEGYLSERDSGRKILYLENEFATLNAEAAPGVPNLILDGREGTSAMELIYNSARAANPSYPDESTQDGDEPASERNNRVPAVFEMMPVVVNDGSLSINLSTNDPEDDRIILAGLEVYPVLANNITILEQPQDRTVAQGFGTTLRVRAAGNIDYIAWYQGDTVGDTDNASLVAETTYTDDVVARSNTVTLDDLVNEGTYWAVLENQTVGEEETVYTDAATISLCNYDASTPGSCGRFYIDAGRDSGTLTARDGTIWHPDTPYRSEACGGTAWNEFKCQDNGLNGLTANNFELDHTHDAANNSVFHRWVEMQDFEYAIPISNGTYTLRLYFHDEEERDDRAFDIIVEGAELIDGYNVFIEAGSHNEYRMETFTATVLDGELNLRFDRDSNQSILSAIEVVPQSSGETFVWPADVTLDNNSSGVSTSGSWASSTNQPGWFGSDYIHDGNTGGSTDKSATYTTTLPESGVWRVRAWWPADANRATNATYTVKHMAGENEFTVNQEINGGVWVTLGEFPFDPNFPAEVVISNNNAAGTQPANGYVIADAVQFEFAGKDALIPNGDFETGALGSWNEYDVASDSLDVAEIDVVTSNSYSGTYSAEICDSAGGRGLFQTVTVKPNMNYEVSAYIKTDGAGDTAYLYAKRATGVNDDSVSHAGNTYQQVSMLYTTQSDQTTMEIGIWRDSGMGSGCAYIDNVWATELPPESILVDNTDSGVTFSDTWSSSTNHSGYIGSNYQWTDYNSTTRTVTYPFNVTFNTTYNVYGWWSIDASKTNERASNVLYTINHAGGSDEVRVDQSSNGNQWVLLGTYTFDPSSPGSVIISNDGATAQHVIADAIKIEQAVP